MQTLRLVDGDTPLGNIECSEQAATLLFASFRLINVMRKGYVGLAKAYEVEGKRGLASTINDSVKDIDDAMSHAMREAANKSNPRASAQIW